MSKYKILIVILIFLIVNSFPYLYAAINAGDSHVFSGLLFNAYDGYSYLAKMAQGYAGSWTFTLPYTANPGQGTYIYLFYIFLGNLSRWLHLDCIYVYHIVRLLGGLYLGFSLAAFSRKFMVDDLDSQFKAFLLSLFGSGLGYIFFLLIDNTADFSVAEGYPLLATLTNAHFPYALGLVLNALMLFRETVNVRRGAYLVLIGLALAIISPFGLVIVGMVMGIQIVWCYIEERLFIWLPAFLIGIGAGPYSLYLVWVYRTHPQIKVWQEQNITLTPAIYDIVISLSPAFLFAIVGAYSLLRDKAHPGRKLWLSWFIGGALLLYIPFSLQRRLLIAYYIPCAFLAVIGLLYLLRNRRMLISRIYFWVFGLSLPTNILLIVLMLYGIQTHYSFIYYTKSEAKAMTWIQENTPFESIILSSPDMGTVIPAETGRRVIYGHHFETPQADYNKALTEAYFEDSLSDTEKIDLETSNGVDYIFLGPREHELGFVDEYLERYPIVYRDEDVTIFQVGFSK